MVAAMRKPQPRRAAKSHVGRTVKKAPRADDARLTLIARATNDVLWDWNIVGNRLWWNDAITTIFGYPLTEVAPDISWWQDRIHPEDRARVSTAVEAALRGDRRFWSDEYRFRRSDGSYAYVFDRGYIVRDAKGAAVRAVGAMADLTERKRAKEELQLTEERLSFAVTAAGLGTWQYDLDTGEISCCERCRQIFGISSHLPITYNLVIEKIHPEDRPRIAASVTAALTGATDYEAEFRILRLDGTLRWITARGRVHSDQMGKPSTMEGVVFDVTDRAVALLNTQRNLERIKVLRDIETAVASTLE